jgi:hypothetical protein
VLLLGYSATVIGRLLEAPHRFGFQRRPPWLRPVDGPSVRHTPTTSTTSRGPFFLPVPLVYV